MASTDRRLAVAALVLAAVALTGCRRKRPPTAKVAWLGASGGCVSTPMHPTSGTFACWGSNDVGQIGDGTTTPRPFATRMTFEAGDPSELALGERHGCGVFGHTVACWGDGTRGQLGAGTASSPLPVRASTDEEEAAATIAVHVGGAHTCIGNGERLRCFGANDVGQLGRDWAKTARIRSFALGAAHTCVAYTASSAGPESVVCRGRATAAPAEPILVGVPVKELAAGGDHGCALLGNGTVSCWGKNDHGQLGDGTKVDSLVPVSVPGLAGAIQVVTGWRHTCALLHVGTVACWGANEAHQLASGSTDDSASPRTIVGLVGVKELSVGGDGTCARLEGGYVRCWGRNDRHQLGSGSGEELSVPVQINFR